MRVREYARAHDPSPSRTRALLARSSSSRDRSHLNLPMRCSPSRRRGRGEERRNERKRRDKKGTLWKYTGRGRSILFVSGCSRGDSKRSPVTRTSSFVEEKKKRERDRDVYFLPEEPRNRSRIDRGCYRVGKRGITLRSADVIYKRVKETSRGNLS